MTAVEWLEENLDVDIRLFIHCKDVFEQAKEMEKQQIIDAFVGYDSDTEDNLEIAEQYYNETFKNK